MRHTCRWCGLTFIGTAAVIRWSDHTWVHADQVPELQAFADAGD